MNVGMIQDQEKRSHMPDFRNSKKKRIIAAVIVAVLVVALVVPFLSAMV